MPTTKPTLPLHSLDGREGGGGRVWDPKVCVPKMASPYPQLERGQSISPTGKGPSRSKCLIHNTKLLERMHNKTHQCTRNEGKAYMQLIIITINA